MAHVVLTVLHSVYGWIFVNINSDVPFLKMTSNTMEASQMFSSVVQNNLRYSAVEGLVCNIKINTLTEC